MAKGERKVVNPGKKRDGENPFLASFSLWHVNLAYWMGLTLGDGSKSLGDWQKAIRTACGADIALGNLTPTQAKNVIEASGIFTGSAAPETLPTRMH